MTLLAIPNVSEGRDRDLIGDLVGAVEAAGGRVIDVHSDAVHNRSVLTVTGTPAQLVEAGVALARACRVIDLTAHHGVHPRLGALDVYPIVPIDEPMHRARAVADEVATAIASRAGLPVYLYGEAARRPATRALSSLRRGGLQRLAERARGDLPPDHGHAGIDPRSGVVCVGARPVLVAFNVWLAADVSIAADIAARVRASAGGLPGVQALGLAIEPGVSQVSMNLVRPQRTGVDTAFAAVDHLASRRGVEVIGTEIVGVPPRRAMPDPSGRAAALLLRPVRSLEQALAEAARSRSSS